jgi:hypothetical protein
MVLGLILLGFTPERFLLLGSKLCYERHDSTKYNEKGILPKDEREYSKVAVSLPLSAPPLNFRYDSYLETFWTDIGISLSTPGSKHQNLTQSKFHKNFRAGH